MTKKEKEKRDKISYFCHKHPKISFIEIIKETTCFHSNQTGYIHKSQQKNSIFASNIFGSPLTSLNHLLKCTYLYLILHPMI